MRLAGQGELAKLHVSLFVSLYISIVSFPSLYYLSLTLACFVGRLPVWDVETLSKMLSADSVSGTHELSP